MTRRSTSIRSSLSILDDDSKEVALEWEDRLGALPSIAKAMHSSPASTLVTPLADIDVEWDDRKDYEAEVDERTTKTFVQKEESRLQIRRLLTNNPSLGEGFIAWPTGNEVFDSIKVREFASQKQDRCQVYYIKQKNSHSRLWITRELMDELFRSYKIFLRFWDQVFNFGLKVRHSDISHSPFRFRIDKTGTYECAYALKYTERNFREADVGDEDHEPWSVRQCAVYQQYNTETSRVVVIIISPSSRGQKRVESALLKAHNSQLPLNPFDLHRILISTALENWRWYIRSLEDRMTDQAEKVILAEVGDKDENLSPLTNFTLNFTDRQRLKILEDKVLDLKIIFDSLLDTITNIKIQCKKGHSIVCRECDCEGIAAELEEQIHEVRVNQKKAETLHRRAQGTAELLSDLLDYENSHALNQLAKESKDITEKGTKDAAAINIVIIITLVYLPITVVASIFSSQLIKVDDMGQVSVASGAWWFAAIAVPLTILTMVAWRAWVAWAAKTDRMRLALRKENRAYSAPTKIRRQMEIIATEVASGSPRGHIFDRFRKRQMRQCIGETA